MNDGSVVSSVAAGSSSVFAVLTAWIDSSQVDVIYKALALVVVLLVFGFWDKTRKFAGWAALAILALLLIQQNQNPSTSPAAAPAGSP